MSRFGEIWEYEHRDSTTSLLLVIKRWQRPGFDEYWHMLNLETGLHWSVSEHDLKLYEAEPCYYAWRRYL